MVAGGLLRRSCLDLAGGQAYWWRLECFSVKATRSRRFPRCKSGVPRFSEAEDRLDRVSAWPGWAIPGGGEHQSWGTHASVPPLSK